MSEKETKIKVISHKIPAITRTALAFAVANHKANIQEIADQTLEVLGLNAEENWNVNFNTGFVTREVPADA